MGNRTQVVRGATVAVLSFRIAYGAALIVAPAKVAGNRWLGAGAREVGLHGLALAAFLSGGPVRPLLAASVAGDLTDIGSTALARDGLPDGSAAATAAVAGGSALLTVVLAALADD